MKHKLKRLLVLLMVLSMVVGLMPTAIAAAAGEETDEDTVNDLYAELISAMPDPLAGYDPLDPDNPYPYGVPVDNFYPEELLTPDPYAVSTMADLHSAFHHFRKYLSDLLHLRRYPVLRHFL